jgi:GNAT superfamily N-acetyltransferase
MQRRGITEKSVYLTNPLPAFTDAEILKRAGLDDTTEAHQGRTLAMDWQYSAGAEREFIRLHPGDFQIMRASDAGLMLKELSEQGLASYPVDADEATIKQAREQGVRRAITFYADRGLKRVQEIRKKFGLTKDEIEERRHDYWSFYYNQAIADMLRESLTPKKGASKAA